ncbi:MAG: hypothetical protein B9J98_08180 [Candidatus Terraquivivens tikiterensis]|uniref:Uncharacterized protein n=1 Tax=Candidatus Terraquivivens tikiterensis TaxID=1980982 RepID=A0A2R7Y0F8_9ARCH|nr:MAG: hypothetical protein B9J98_08180 [Candidatus Terraquivivens tikiterensis]
MFVEKGMSKGVKDEASVIGWVELIVMDKYGNIKYRVGSSKENVLSKNSKDECKDGKNCAFFSSIPTKLVDILWSKNVITNVGIACIIRLVFAGLTENKFGYLAIGTGTTTEAVTDTALQSEIARKAATVTQETTSIEGDTAKLEAIFSSADGLIGTHNVSELGVFNAPSGGYMIARKVVAAVPVNWDAGETLAARYFIQMTR